MRTLKELAERYEELLRRKKKATSIEGKASKEIREVESEMYDVMVAEECQNWKTSKGTTFYRRIDKFYGVADEDKKEDFISALANCEKTRDLVEANYNSNSLRARIKEIEGNGETLPEEIMSLLKVHEKYKVGHR